ncbi:MAG: DUF4330 domain-containing protein [Vampirovibrionales bacterium]|nr:DUF4330 domain-containing protein [Vampirovibrionales bacterium]
MTLPSKTNRFTFNMLDALTVVLLALVALILLLVQSGWHKTASKQVLGEAAVTYTIDMVAFRMQSPETTLKAGDTAHLYIRNQPRGDIKISHVERRQRMVVAPVAAGSKAGYQLVPDPNLPNGYDVTLTLADKAQMTQEGVVANGVRIKTGMPVEIETPKVRASGVITDITVAPSP